MRRDRNKINKDITDDYLADRLDEDTAAGKQRFGKRSKHHSEMKTRRTHQRREKAQADDRLRARVIEVHGLYCTLETKSGTILGTVRKTLQKVLKTRVVVGDVVRYVDSPNPEPGSPQAVVESIDERKSILCRADSFKAQHAWPIVANADQVLIVASIVKPRIKWGLIDRMIVASQSGKLEPIVCINKIDLDLDESTRSALADSRERLSYYRSLGVTCLETSVMNHIGLDSLRSILTNRITILAGHSGVGKSSLIRAICPQIDLKVGEVSTLTDKGRHTTTSARIYKLDDSSEVIDTPGVKLFGLWNVDHQKLEELFSDVLNETAPAWRVQSYQRLCESLR